MKNNKTNEKSGVIKKSAAVSAAEAVVQRNIQIMRITLALTVLSFLTFSITLTSSYWIVISYPPDFFLKRHKMHVVRATYGLIWECVVGRPTLNAMYGKYSCFTISILKCCQLKHKNIKAITYY